MALGLPIVSTNVGGIPNLLTHNQTAKLVDKNNISAMVNQIKDYLSNPSDSLFISKNARELVEAQYDESVIIPKWINIIDEKMKTR